MGSNSSFYNQNSTVYTETNPAAPADTPVSSPDTDAASSFFKGTGGTNPSTIIAGIHEFTPIAHKWLTGVDSNGVWSYAQPAFTDLSGIIDNAQLPADVPLSIVNDTNIQGAIAANALTLSWAGTLAAARLNANVVQGVTNDTNITGSIAAQNLTLGWTGTLAAARLNANVVQGVTNDTNIHGSISAQTLTFSWSGTLAAARLNSNVVQGVTNDTNITGSISAQNLTLGWTGHLGLSRGGTAADLSATGGASQVLKQVSVGAAITVGQLTPADLAAGNFGIDVVTGPLTLAHSDGSITSTGKLTLGANNQFGDLLELHSTGLGLDFAQWSNDSSGGGLFLLKSRGASIGSHVVVQNGDQIFNIRAKASDGTSFFQAARIAFKCDASPSAGIVPGRIEFRTNNTSGTDTEAARIDSSQRLGIGAIPGFDATPYGINYHITKQTPGNSLQEQWISVGNYGGGNYILAYNTRGADTTVFTAVQSGDTIFSIWGWGADGTASKEVGSLNLNVDGTPSAGVVPGAWIFSTTRSDGVNREAFRIDSSGEGIFTQQAGAFGILVNANTGAPAIAAGFNTASEVVGFALSNSSTGQIDFQMGTNNGTNAQFQLSVNDGGLSDFYVSKGSLRFVTAQAGKVMRWNAGDTGNDNITVIDSPKYVQICGTGSPQSTLEVNGPIATKPNTIVTGVTTYTVADTDSALVFNCAATCTITLPAASSCPGRWITLKTIAAFTVVSASSNVTAATNNTPAASILTAVAGRYAVLQSDGTNWVKMYGGTGA